MLVEFVETRRTGAEDVYQTSKLTYATVSGMGMHLNEPRPGEPADNRALEDVSLTFQRIEFENKPAKTAAMDDWSR